MTPRQLADLAAVLARHADEIHAAVPPSAEVLHRVRRRFAVCLRGWRDGLFDRPTPGLYAEIFAAELPLRVWCTAAAASDRGRSRGRGSAVAGRLFSDLLDLRCLALQGLAADHGLAPAEAAAIDRFRRRCERWADVLLGPLSVATGVTDYTLRPDRAADFAPESGTDPFGEGFWSLAAVGLRLSFAPADGFRGVEERDSAAAGELGAALLATLPPSAFGSDGRLRPLVAGRAGRAGVDSPVPRRSKPIRSPRPGSLPQPTAGIPPATAPHAISFSSLRKRRPIE